MKKYFFLIICSLLGSSLFSVVNKGLPEKEYYLVDSLSLDELTIYDQQILDSALGLYHNSKNDTDRLNALGIVQQNLIHNDWVKYNNLIEEIAQQKLQGTLPPPLKLFYLKYLALSLNNNGINYAEKGEIRKSLKYYLKSLKISKEIGDKNAIATAYTNIGTSYDDLGKLAKALEYYFKGLKILEEQRNKKAISAVFNNIGFIYYQQYNSPKALEYFNKSLEINSSTGNKNGMAIDFNNIGLVFQREKDYTNALKYHDKSLKIREEIGYNYGIVESLVNIGLVYRLKGELTKALSFYKKSLTFSKEIGHKKLVSSLYCKIGGVYNEQGDIKAAKKNAIRSLNIAKETESPIYIKPAAELLSIIYKKEGDYKKGWEMYDLYISIKDSINNNEIEKIAIQQEANYKIEKKKQAIVVQKKQIEVLNERNKHQTLRIKQKNQLLIGLGGGVLLVIVIIILVILNQKANTKKKESDFARKQSELKQQALRAQMNPHFLFNSLNSIQRIYVEGNMMLANDYMADFSALLRSILNNSDKEKISIQEDLQMLELYMTMEKVRTGGQINYKINVDGNIDKLQTHIPPMIIQPFVENAIWHGILPSKKKGNISIGLKQINDEMLECAVQDDGVGIQTSRKNKKEGHISKGMNLTKERLGERGGVLEEELPEGGTKITIKIPIS